MKRLSLLIIPLLLALLSLPSSLAAQTAGRPYTFYTVSGTSTQIAVVEAEHYGVIGGPWSTISDSAQSGQFFMRSDAKAPGAWTNTGDMATNAPSLRFRVLFPYAGVFYFRARAYAVDAGADTIGWGIDGIINNDTMHNVGTGLQAWTWTSNSRNPGFETMSNTWVTAGEHWVNVYAREDGVYIDKIMIASSAYVVSGLGPTESAIGGATNTPGITATPTRTPTPTRTSTPTLTPTLTPTPNPVHTPTPTPTRTPTLTHTPTDTPPPSVTPTPTGVIPTATRTPVPTTDGSVLYADQGWHLFLDDYWIDSTLSYGVSRRVNSPVRHLSSPVLTSAATGVSQPFVTVLERQPGNPAAGYIMWFQASGFDTAPDYFGPVVRTATSPDGIAWTAGALITGIEATYVEKVLDSQIFNDPARYRSLYVRIVKPVASTNWMQVRSGYSADGYTWTDAGVDNIFAGQYASLTENTGDIFDTFRLSDGTYVSFARLMGPYAWTDSDSIFHNEAAVRRVGITFSSNFVNWSPSPPSVLFSPDSADEGITQFYGGPSAVWKRGDLYIGFLKMLRDDVVVSGAPAGAYGQGWSVLAWSRDGRNWTRDREPFFSPNPSAGTWDHAHAWLSSQIEVGGVYYLYYGGYKWGHKYAPTTDRQIGMVRLTKDRYALRWVGGPGNWTGTGRLVTKPLRLAGNAIRLNVDAGDPTRSMAVTVLDAASLRTLSTCGTLTNIDSTQQPITCSPQLDTLGGVPVRLRFDIVNGGLAGFEVYGINPIPATSTPTPTRTPIPTATPTPTRTPPPQPTATPIPGATATPTPTLTPTITLTPSNTPTLQPITAITPISGIVASYDWDYAGTTRSYTDATGNMFGWRTIEPDRGTYAWTPIDDYISTVAASGKKAVIRVVLRCMDVQTTMAEWASGKRGDVCAPTWATVGGSIYAPIQENTSSITTAGSCQAEVSANPYRLNYLDSDVTAALGQLINALAARYGSNANVAAIEFGLGYNGENKPAAKSGSACDYAEDTAAYTAEYGSQRAAYSYLVPAVDDTTQILASTEWASRQWTWYAYWMQQRLSSAFRGRKPVYVSTGAHFATQAEIALQTRRAISLGLLNWQAGAEKYYALGASNSSVCAWTDARRPGYNTSFNSLTLQIGRAHWGNLEIWGEQGGGQTYFTVEQSQTYDRYPSIGFCTIEANKLSELCVNIHQRWTTLNMLDKGVRAYEPFHNDLNYGGQPLDIFWSTMKPYWGKSAAQLGAGWVYFRGPNTGYPNTSSTWYCGDPFDYSLGVRTELDTMRPAYSADSALQTTLLLTYQNEALRLNEATRNKIFVGPQNDTNLTWRGEGGRVLTQQVPWLNLDIEDSWYYANESGTPFFVLTFYDGDTAGGEFSLVYDSESGEKTWATYTLGGTKTWVSYSMSIPDVWFGNRLPSIHALSPHGFDLSLRWQKGAAPIVISSLAIYGLNAVPVATNTPAPTPTITLTWTPTPTRTPTPLYTPTITPTATAGATPTPTVTPTDTPTPTVTRTATIGPLPTETPTPTATQTPTITSTATLTPTGTRGPTKTSTPTTNPTATTPPTLTPTAGPSPTWTPTVTDTPTVTPYPTRTHTPTRTPTVTTTPYPTAVATAIVFNEVAPGTEDSNGNGVIEPFADQCIEIFNGDDEVSVVTTGWTLRNNDRIIYQFPTTTFRAGSRFTIFGARFLNSWRLQPGTLTLKNGSGATLATLNIADENLLSDYAASPDGGTIWAQQGFTTCGFRNDAPTPSAGWTPRPTGTPYPTYTPTRTPTPARTITPTPTVTRLPGTATPTRTATPRP